MNAVIIILSYGKRYEIPIFTVEQAKAYLKEYNEDNGFCYLYVGCWAEKALQELADEIFEDVESFREFIETNRKKWIGLIKEHPLYGHIDEFCLQSLFGY